MSAREPERRPPECGDTSEGGPFGQYEGELHFLMIL
jgi:hypothetical protein